MSDYMSDGKKILGVEYDFVPMVNDTLDSMLILSTNMRSAEELGVFMLESDGSITVYVLDEIYIVGKADGFHNLLEAIEAWNNEEI